MLHGHAPDRNPSLAAARYCTGSPNGRMTAPDAPSSPGSCQVFSARWTRSGVRDRYFFPFSSRRPPAPRRDSFLRSTHPQTRARTNPTGGSHPPAAERVGGIPRGERGLILNQSATLSRFGSHSLTQSDIFSIREEEGAEDDDSFSPRHRRRHLRPTRQRRSATTNGT